jgi:large subunit ribosomal protein L19
MSYDLIRKVADASRKPQVVDVRSGDTVRVYQKIKEGNKTRTQMFEGVVIRMDRRNSVTARMTVRKIASGVGVEKSYLLHSPLVEKIEVMKRGKVRRNYLTYLRARTGKSARLVGKEFDKSINDVDLIEEVIEEKSEVEGQDNADEVEAVKIIEEKLDEQVAEDAETAKGEARAEAKDA